MNTSGAWMPYAKPTTKPVSEAMHVMSHTSHISMTISRQIATRVSRTDIDDTGAAALVLDSVPAAANSLGVVDSVVVNSSSAGNAAPYTHDCN